MTTATKPQMITLPATDVEAPASDYTLSKVTTMQGRESEAYNAVIKRGKTVVGEAHNDGNGGETFIHFINRDEQALFNEYVAQWPKWDLGPNEDGTPNLVTRTPDNVVDALQFEWSQLRYIKRVTKTKFYIQLSPYESGTLSRLTHETPGALEIAIKSVGHSNFKYWNGTGLVPAAA